MKIRNLFKFKSQPNYMNFDQFWVQKIDTITINKRLQFFENYCQGKKVLHFGCTDWPIFKPETNLHIQLSKVTKELHGFDIDKEGIDNLKKYVNQKYFSNFSDIKEEKYDICIVPETIEHVDNVRFFLEGISTIEADTFLITAPNCFSEIHLKRNFQDKNQFIEVVHPDHNCWYSPFTLKNQIEKYSTLKVINTYLLEQDMMICCEAVKK